MRKIIKGKILFSILIILVTLFSCDIDKQIEVKLNSLVFSANSYETTEGKITEFSAFVSPKDFDMYLTEVNIESSDRNILTVSVVKFKDGILTFSTTAKKAGTVTITITAKDKSAKAMVKVNPSLIPSLVVNVNSINLSHKIVFLSLNESLKLTTNVLPKNADDTTVTWVSRGTGIFVDDNGVVTAKQTGNFQVVAISNQDNSITDTCKVFVVINVNKITISNKNILLRKGEERTLTAIVLPSNAVNKLYTWKSDNGVVSVNQNGLIKGVDYGVAKITVTSVSNINISDQATVTVASLNINKNKLTLDKNKLDTLKVTILPNNLSDKSVTWSSDNENIATIDVKNGIITPKLKGVANIIAKSVYNSLLLDTCVLTVINPVDSVRINFKKLNLIEGLTQKLSATVYPLDAEELTVTWSSSNNAIATVDPASGEVKALKSGNTNIIVTSNYGDKSKKDTCVLNVDFGKYGILLSDYVLKLKENQKKIVSATIKIPVETNKNVSWHSDNDKIAYINSTTGEITAIKEGKVNIIAISDVNPNVKDTCKLTVIVGLDAIKLDKTNLNLDIRSTENIIVTFEPPNATEKDYTWSNDNSRVVTVDNTGKITTNSFVGTAILKATSNSDNTVFATCTVNVSIFVKNILLNEHSLSLGTQEFATLSYILNPLNPSNSDVIWSSNNVPIVNVVNGKLNTGILGGNAKIYVQSVSNPEVKDSCTVTVYVKATDMTISESILTLNKNDVKMLKTTIIASSSIDQSVTWSSSDENIATVSLKDGVIIAKNPGTAEIKATSVVNPTLFKICKLTVIIPVSSVTLDQDTIRLFTARSKNLNYTILPIDATDKSITWSKNSPSISIINGLVYGIDAGSGYVYITTNNGLKDSCYVIVTIKATGMTLSENVLTLNKDDKKTLTAIIEPSTTAEKSVIWTSADENIATVSRTGGEIIAKNPGTVEIKATSVSDNTISRVCILTVIIPVKSVTLDQDTIRLYKNDSKTLKATVLPIDATDKSLLWSSAINNFNIYDGLVIGSDAGQGYVYVKSKNGIKDSCYVIVSLNSSDMILSQSILTLNKFEKKILTAEILPITTPDRSVVWSSSNENIATVSKYGGEILAKDKGNVDIIATSVSNSALSRTCKLTVIIPVTNVNIIEDTIRFFQGDIKNLTALVLPTDASDISLIWRRTNPIISITNGFVSSSNAGEGYVYATSNNGIKDSCYVIVSIKATSILLSENILTLKKGDKKIITANVLPTTTTDKSVTWYSLDETIATVSKNGEIEAKAKGNVDIKVISNSDPNIYEVCKLTVIIPVEKVTITEDTIRLFKSESKTLIASISPVDASDKTIIWRSTNVNIKVFNGFVFGEDAGSGYVYATSNNDFKDSCYVIVSLYGTSMKLSQNVLSLKKDEKATLTAEITPLTSDQSVTWSSSDPTIASVSKNGEITAISKGTVEIIATSVTNKALSRSCILTVILPVSTVIIVEDTIRMYKDEDKNLTFSVLPTDASDKTLTWSSLNSNIKVFNGLVSGLNEAKGYVYATSNNNLKDSCFVIVYLKPNLITLSENVLTLNINNKKILTATILPTTTPDKSVTWISSNTSIATVSNNGGEITALSPGDVDIIATSVSNPLLSATCKLKVVIPVSNVNIVEDTVRIYKFDYKNLNYSVLPTNASDKSLTWSRNVSNVTISNGLVYGLEVGEGYVFATSNNGIKDSCYVIVTLNATGMKLSQSILTLNKGGKATITAEITPLTSNQAVIWTSSDESIATVTRNGGEINAVSKGVVEITATSVTNTVLSRVCVVTVILPVSSVTLDKDTIKLFKGNYYNLIATVLPVDASDVSVTWTSNNIDKISVVKGLVYAADEGEGYVYATSNNGKKDSCFVKVSLIGNDMTLSKSILSLNKNQSTTLSAVITPLSADQSVTWTSSDVNIATVSNNGLVNAKEKGVVDIIATSKINPSLSRTCKLTVLIPITNVNIVEDTIRIYKSDFKNLQYSTLPTDASDNSLIWSSFNSTKVSISNGLVYGEDVGQGYVYATANNGIKDSCYVIVRIKVNDMNLSPSKLVINRSDSKSLTLEVLPSTATDKSVIWNSYDETIATVTNQGLVKAISKGVTTIKVTSVNDPSIYRTSEVTVVVPVTSVSLNEDTIRLYKSEYKNLIATVLPNDASDKTLNWISINSISITVNNGTVYGNNEGAGYVYVNTVNGLKDSCYVIVSLLGNSMVLSQSDLILNEKETKTLTATIYPITASQSVTWTSSDVSIATVTLNGGFITAIRKGDVNIIATSVTNSALSSICKLKVIKPVSTVSILEDTIRIFNGIYKNLTYSVLPTDANDISLTWKSINNKILVNNGLVNSDEAAEGYVFATANNGVKDSCYVIVSIKVTELNLSPSLLTLNRGAKSTLILDVKPTNASNKSVIWSSTSSQIASVSNAGEVTANAKGSATIKAISVSDPSISSSSVITVVVPVSSVNIIEDTIKLFKNDFKVLSYTVLPADASDNSLTWSSYNLNIISVTNGLVNALDIGEGYIFAKSINGIKDSCYVKVSLNGSDMTLSKSTLTLNKGETTTLTASILPSTADQSVTWSSSDPNIATVTLNGGYIETKSKGVVYIRATSVTNPSLMRTCELTVVIPVVSVSIIEDTIRLYKNDSKNLYATVLPNDASDNNVIWRSTNTNIFTVNNGLVYAVEVGDGFVFATTSNGKKDSCYVSVTIKATGMTLSPSSLTLNKDETRSLTAEITPITTSDKRVIWSSNNPSIATVSSVGLVRAISPGSAVITATSVSDPTIYRTCSITVVIPVTSVTLNVKNLKLFKSESSNLIATVIPQDATDKTISWTSTNSNITVNNGLVTGNDVGEGYVIVTTSNGLKDTCLVVVSPKASGVSITPSSYTLNRYQSKVLVATVSSTVPVDQTVTWKSSDENIATVSSVGLVYAKAKGNVDIIATSVYDTKLTGTSRITVIVPVESVSISQDTVRLEKGGSITLSAIVLPIDVSDNTLAWRSTNSNIFVSNGYVYGDNVGEGYVYATAINDKRDSCYIIVSITASDMLLSPTTLTLNKNEKRTLSANLVPTNTTNKLILWQSSDVSVATVSSTGEISAISSGTANIIATSVSNPSIIRSCALTVVVPVTSVNITDDTIRIYKDDYKDLVATVLPSDATNKNLTWFSPNSNITVSGSGRVTGVNMASNYVYVTTSNGLKDSCYVIVSLKATGMTLSESTLTLNKGGNRTLTATIISTVTVDQSVTWSSSNTLTATVSSAGYVQALNAGSVDIKATSVSFPSLSAICKLTVINPVTSIKLNKDTLRLFKGNTETLLATVLPSDADQTITWSSNNNNIPVTNGSVNGLDAGEGDVVVTSSNGLKDTCRVIVKDLPNVSTFKFEASKNPGMQTDAPLTKIGNYAYKGDFKYIGKVKLIPTFTTPAGTIVKVNNIEQTSGVSVQDFTSPVIYTVYGSDNSLIETLRVSVNFINDTLDVSTQGVLICKPSYISTIRTVILADSMNGQRVTSIGNNAFELASNIISNLNLPNTITSIGDYAFNGCTNMVGNLNFPNIVTNLGEGAFKRCTSLKGNIVIPPLITKISNKLFSECNGLDGSVSIPNTVTTIGNYAFEKCYLLSGFNIPTSIEVIGNYAFYVCSSLRGSFNFPNTLTTIGDAAFSACYNMTGSLILPNSITSLGTRAFSACQGLTGSLSLPNTLTTIKLTTFFNCTGLTGDLIIPNSVTVIEGGAFGYLTRMSTITLPNGLIEIGGFAFTEMTYLQGNLIIPNTVTRIGEGAFYKCKASNQIAEGTLQLSSNLTSIGDSAFKYSGFVGNLTIPNSVTTIPMQAFCGSKNFNGNLTLPSELLEIKDSAFANCGKLIGNLNIPNKLSKIGVSGFEDCIGFTGNLNIPANVISIGNKGFKNCNGFTTITYKGSTTLGTDVFSGIDPGKISTY